MRSPAVPPTPSQGNPAKETHIEVLSAAPIQEHEATPPLPATVIADATEKGDPAKNELKPTVETVYAEVQETKTVHDGVTGRVTLRKGKIVSNAQYDLRALHRQGVSLKRVEAAKVEDPYDTSFLG